MLAHRKSRTAFRKLLIHNVHEIIVVTEQASKGARLAGNSILNLRDLAAHISDQVGLYRM